MNRFLLLLAFLAFASVPVVIGNAEKSDASASAKAGEEKTGEKTAEKGSEKAGEHKADAKAAEGKTTEAKGDAKAEGKEEKVAEHHRKSNECLASEEVIQDLEAREKKLKEREDSLGEKEKAMAAQESAIKEELAKLESARNEIQGVHAKALADREEKVSKLMETLESMSPKSAAAVINGVDDELAVTALSRLTSVKAGKVLANLKPDKSSKLSELMAYGRASTGKEKANVESSERAPASKR